MKKLVFILFIFLFSCNEEDIENQLLLENNYIKVNEQYYSIDTVKYIGVKAISGGLGLTNYIAISDKIEVDIVLIDKDFPRVNTEYDIVINKTYSDKLAYVSINDIKIEGSLFINDSIINIIGNHNKDIYELNYQF